MQNKIIADIEAIEQQINTAEKLLETLSGKTMDILKKYLDIAKKGEN